MHHNYLKDTTDALAALEAAYAYAYEKEGDTATEAVEAVLLGLRSAQQHMGMCREMLGERQRELVRAGHMNEMAREKADAIKEAEQMKTERNAERTARKALRQEKIQLEREKAALEQEKAALEARIATAEEA